MRKKLIFLVLILAIIFSAVGITSIINNRNDFKGPIKAEGLVTTTMDKPTDGSLPTEYDNYDNVAILAGVMEDASFTGLTTGEVVADVAFINYKQKVNNIRTVLDNRAFQQAISYSSLKSVAMQKYFYLDQNKVLTRSGSKVTEDNASWGTNTPDVYSFTQYKNIYGWLPNQISAYIISKETILEISDITTLEDGTYSITMSLDPKKAPANYQYEVKAYGGAKDFPSFSSVSLTVYFNNDWELLKIDTSEVYDISMPGLGSLTCTSNLSEVFSYTDVKMDENYTSYFESYSNLVPSDGETVPVDDSLEPLDYLMYAFGDYLNGDILYLDVNLMLNDNLIEAKLALDIKNMKIVLTSNIFNVVYEDNILYLDYQGLKFKLNPSDFSELLGGINLDLDLTSLMDQINEAQITKTENSAVMEANLSLLGINLPVSFTFDVNGEAVKLKSVVLNTTISDFKIGLTATVTNEFNYEYDINNYQDLKNAKFILADILNIINNKALGVDLALNYEGLALKANGKLSFVDDIYMDLAFNLNYDSLNIDGSLKLVNNKLYLDVLGLKLYYEIDLDLNLDPNALIKEVLNISIDKLVSSLLLDESGLALELNIEELLINLKINDLENGLNINVNNLLNIDIYSDAKPFALDIDDTLYTNLNDLMPFITKLLDLVNNNYLEMNLATTINLFGNDINVDGLVKLDLKNLMVEANLKVMGIDINLYLKDNVLYLEVGSITYKSSLDDLLALFNLNSRSNLALNIEFKDNNLYLNINDFSLIISIVNDNLNISLADLDFNGISIKDTSLVVSKGNSFDINIKDEAMLNSNDLVYLKELINNLSFVLVDKALSLDFGFSLDLKTTSFVVDGNLNIDFKDGLVVNGLIKFITNKNIIHQVYLAYVGDYLYVSYGDLGIKVTIDELISLVNEVTSLFDVDLDLNSSFDLSSLLNNINIDVTDSLLINIYDLALSISKDLNILVSDLNFAGVVINDISLSVNEFNNYDSSIKDINYLNYNDLANLLLYVDDIIKLINNKYLNLSIKAEAILNDNVYDISGNIYLDFSNGLSLKASLYLETDSVNYNSHYFDLYYYDNYIYIIYKNNLDSESYLAFKANMADLNELLDTISDFLNYDFSDLTNAADKLTGFNIIDLIDSLDLSTLIKGLTVSDNSLSVVLGKELLGLNNDFVISLNRDTKLNSISLNDISISGIVVNANLMLNEGLEEIVVPSDYKYYDLSSLNPLVKAIFNTALLGEFNITSNINVKATIIGIDINMNIPLSLNIKLEKGSNLPVVKLQMQIPVIVGVNEDVPYLVNDTFGSENRILTIYYKDHNIYIHRTETKNTFFGNGRTYEKKLWLDEETFFDNVLDYLLDFGFGFSDSIMDAILESLNTGEYLIDYTNVLLDFDASLEEGRHSLTINLAEIANNPQLDKFTINLFTNNIDDKSYLTKATFDVNMPVASGVNFTISTSDLALNNIGEAVDLSDLETYIATYPYEKGLFYQYQDNKWVLASEERNLVLDMAGFYDNVTLTGLPSSKLDLPTFDTYIEKDGKLYQFKGWYKDNNYQEEFLDYVMPANGGIVYAKFEEVKQYDLTIVDGIGGFDKVLSVYEGLEFSLPSINELVLKDSKYYNFIGFYTDSNFENLLTSNIMPGNNLTIYLRYEEVLPIKVTLIDNGNKVVKEINVAYGTIIDSNYSGFMTPELYFDGRMHKFNGWLLNDNLFNGLKLIEDITLYASFTDLYTINYDDGFGNTITSYLEKGSYYELPSFTYELTDYKTYDLNEDIYNVNGNLVKLVGYNIGSYKPNEQVLVEGDLNITLNHKNVYELNVHEIVRRVQGKAGYAVGEHRNYVYLTEGEVDINNILGHKCSTSYSYKSEWIGYCTVTLTGDSVFYLNSNINIYYYEGTSHLV